MESIKRSLMLLKPCGMAAKRGIGGILRLQSSHEGVSLSLKTDCLKDTDCSLYLFTDTGRDIFAGDVKNGGVSATLRGVRLEDIIGAAGVQSEGSAYSFVLRSTGPGWPGIIEKFRITHSPETSPRTGQIGAPYAEPAIEQAAEVNEIAEEPAGGEYPGNFQEETGHEDNGCDSCPHMVRETKVNPFPSVFPNSEWIKKSYPGPAGWWHYLSGKIYRGGKLAAKVVGVPGEYGMTPPIWLEGFGTYLRCVTGDARGYWLMFLDVETGEVLDMGLSRRGG